MSELARNSTSNVLYVIQQRLSSITDSHLQSKVLLDYSELSLSPTVPTSQVIDFLFSFLEQHNQKSIDTTSQTEVETIARKALAGKKNNQAEVVIVYSILKGLHDILQVKPVIVKPMIQVEGMKTQLTRCYSTSEDFKLRSETLKIVLDCLMISKREEEALELALQCMRDSSHHQHEIALHGLLRLLDDGYCLNSHIEQTLEAVAILLHSRESSNLQIMAAQVLIAIAEQNPMSDIKLAILEQHKPLPVPDAVFLLFGQGLISMSPISRAYIAIAVATIADLVSTGVIEDSLQRSQIDERVHDDGTDTLLLTTTGSMLTLLEDPSDFVAVKASYAVGRLLTNSDCSIRVVDRSIKSFFEVFARAASGSSDQVNIGMVLAALKQVLVYRNNRLKLTYLLKIDQMTCILSSLPVPNIQLFELLSSILQLCDVIKGDELDRLVLNRIRMQRHWLFEDLDQELFVSHDEQASLIRNVQAWHRLFVEHICQSPDDVAKLGSFMWRSAEICDSLLPAPELSLLVCHIAAKNTLPQENVVCSFLQSGKLLDALDSRLSKFKKDASSFKPFTLVDWQSDVSEDIPYLGIDCIKQLFRHCRPLAEACKYFYVKSALDNLKSRTTLLQMYGQCCLLIEMSNFIEVTSLEQLVSGIKKARAIQSWQKSVVGDKFDLDDARAGIQHLITYMSILPSNSPKAHILWPLEKQQESFDTLAPYLHQMEVSFVMRNVHDVSRVYIKAQLWDGTTQYHKISRNAYHWYKLDSCKAQYSISFPVSQSADPVCVKIIVCIHHPIGFLTPDEEEDQFNFSDLVPISVEVKFFLKQRHK